MNLPRPAQTLVLVVDDDEPMRSALVHLFKRCGYGCVEATTVAEARQRLDEHDVHLLVADLHLGDGSGLELSRQALAADPHLAVLIVTGSDDPAVAQEATDFGAFGYFVKPFGLTEMRIGAMNAVRRRELEVARWQHTAELETMVEQRATELLEVNRALAVREGRLRSLVESSPMGILYGDETGRCQLINERAEQLLGTGGGDDPQRWLTATHPDDRGSLLGAIGAALSNVPNVDVDLRVVDAGGAISWVRAHVSPVIDDVGVTDGFVAIIVDIDQRRRMEEQLRHQALHDYLTLLPNRRFVQSFLTSALLDLEADARVGVAVIDLDQFKLINDTYGHAAGDDLIRTVAGRLDSARTPKDVVARFGGDEFVAVLVDRKGPEALVGAVEGLRSAVEGSFVVDGTEIFVTASVGLAVASDGQVPAATLLRNADIAMHRAKDRGRNRLEVFDDSLRRRVARRLVVSNALRRSLDGDAIDVHYQPQFDTATGALAGFEALARWYDPELGRVGPDEFIPAAEAAGLVHLIDRRVLRAACGQLARWQRVNPAWRGVGMSVNVSARQLTDPDFVSIITAEISRSGIAPASLCLEITETVLMNEIGRAVSMLEELRSLGVTVAVDDFGTGYSSLSYLRSLPVDFLKIDQSFVEPLARDHGERETSVVAAIIDLAHHFGMAVVAEGVENDEQLDILRRLGCDYAQGFLYSAPLPAEDGRMEAMLAGNDRGVGSVDSLAASEGG